MRNAHERFLPLCIRGSILGIIAVGLRTAATSAIAGIEESSIQALTKFVQFLPSRLRRRVDALATSTTPAIAPRGPTVQVETLTTLALACRDADRLRFGYTTRGGESMERLVEPYRLVALGRRWYLLAWDLVRDDWRTFRIDRLTDPAATDTSFRPRKLPADPAAFVQASIGALPVRYEIDVLVRAPAARVAQEVAEWGTVETVDSGACRLRMQVDDLSWPAMLLGAVDADLEVIQPPELTAYLRRIGERFTAASVTTR